MMRLLLAALATTSAVAFTVPTTSTVTSQSTRLSAFEFDDDNNNISAQIYDPLNLSNDESSTTISNNNKAAAITTALLTAATPLAASANDSPNWGIFEGRTGSLLHPAAMGSMALFSLSTALLGFQWRRQRTLGEEISSLKKQLPNLNGAASVSAAIATAEGAESVDTNYVNTLRGSLSIESQINELSKERKELASAGPKDKHFSQGSLLLFIGTAFAIEVSYLMFVCLLADFFVVDNILSIIMCSLNIIYNYTSTQTKGTTKHIRTCRKTLPRTTFIRRSWTCSAMGIGCINGTSYAKG